MKKILFLLAVVAIGFASCSDNKEEEIDSRTKFVGTYRLSIQSDVTITIDSKTYPWPMDASGKSLVVELDKTNSKYLKVSGYYGETTAEVINGNLYINEYNAKTYKDGLYYQMKIVHGEATITNGILTWDSGIAIVVISTDNYNVGVGSGVLHNKAVR